ncbi:hypothetical protein [Subtercola lobariae]|uniref:Glycosyltransferase n=1 Tax=Subtercola lobariae TaxID=1588641 RepID=A0A917B0F4_9MICO|nr:hypothetical protein [Subtercola lobariae]GGF12782.1 hypothetical protein GCM10011399_03390 [Subtercola lobariae]
MTKISDLTSLLGRAKKYLAVNKSMRELRNRNKTSDQSLLCEAGPVVSLTTHGLRLQTVYYAIESIGRGELRPSRLILWIDERDARKPRPPELARLVARGLEILTTSNYGPHTKYFPYVQSRDRHTTALVTADDDVIYPIDWLSRLNAAHNSRPDLIRAMKVRRVELLSNGFAPYTTWKAVASVDASVLNLALGVSGVIYPPAFLEELHVAGDSFRLVSPRADDIWLHAVAVRTGFLVAQVSASPEGYPTVRGTFETSLMKTNVLDNQNDPQIQATYTVADIERLGQPSA